jgi:rRNA processing protein Gar1
VIGVIDDVFGNVKNPYYCILKDGYVKELIKKNIVKINEKAYIIKGYTKVLVED